MIARLSRRLTSFFVVRGIVPENEMDVYVYGFEILMSTLQNFIALAILSVLIGKVIETVFFLLGFIPLRLIAGGYHAKNHFRCFLILMLVYSAFILLIFIIPVEYATRSIILSYSITAILVFIIAPSEDANKPMSSREAIVFRKRSRIAIASYAALIGAVATVMADKEYALSLTLGLLTVGLSLLANLTKGRKKAGMNKAVSGEGDINNEEA